jgi:hypothetical protein
MRAGRARKIMGVTLIIAGIMLVLVIKRNGKKRESGVKKNPNSVISFPVESKIRTSPERKHARFCA